MNFYVICYFLYYFLFFSCRYGVLAGMCNDTDISRVAFGVAIEHPGNENHERGKIASISFWTDRVMSEVG